MFSRSLLLALIYCTQTTCALSTEEPLLLLTKEQRQQLMTHGLERKWHTSAQSNTTEINTFIKGTNIKAHPTTIVDNKTLQIFNNHISRLSFYIAGTATAFAFIAASNHFNEGIPLVIAGGIFATVVNSFNPAVKEVYGSETLRITKSDDKIKIISTDSSTKPVVGDFTIKRPAITAACIVGAFAAGAFIGGRMAQQ